MIETTCIIEHLQAHAPGAQRLDSGRRARPAGALPRPLLRPARPGQHAACRSTTRCAPRAWAMPMAPSRGDRTCASPTTGSRPTCPMSGWAAGESFTLADCAAAPALFYADWVDEIGDARPRLKAYRARLLAHPASRARSRRRGHTGPISRSAHPTAIRRKPATSAAADRPRSPPRGVPRANGRRRSCRDDSGGRGPNSAGEVVGGRRPRRGPSTDSAAARSW